MLEMTCSVLAGIADEALVAVTVRPPTDRTRFVVCPPGVVIDHVFDASELSVTRNARAPALAAVVTSDAPSATSRTRVPCDANELVASSSTGTFHGAYGEQFNVAVHSMFESDSDQPFTRSSTVSDGCSTAHTDTPVTSMRCDGRTASQSAARAGLRRKSMLICGYRYPSTVPRCTSHAA